MTDRLNEIFDFTDKDLDHNRRGRLSPQQGVRVGASRRRLKRRVLLIGLILLAIAAGWVVIFSQLPVWSAGMIAMAVGIVIFGLPGAAAVYLGLRPPPKIAIEKVQGVAKVARVEHTGRSGNSSYRYVNTEMHLGDRIFVVPDPAFSELEDGAEYAIYSWKGPGDIFSLEKL